MITTVLIVGFLLLVVVGAASFYASGGRAATVIPTGEPHPLREVIAGTIFLLAAVAHVVSAVYLNTRGG
jgi:hypothetical protein